MDASTPMPADLQRQQDRKRKRKAILAGGVVLGLGAAVTLAAWSDDVFADGIFATGTFELEGAVDLAGTTFLPYDGPAGYEDGVGGLTFRQDPRMLTPDVQVFAPISLRLSDDTNVNAATVELVSVTAPDLNPLAGNLDYAVYVDVPPAECTADFTPPTPATSGTISDPTADFDFGGLTATPQQVRQLCLGVTLTSNEEAVQGKQANVTWQFTAASVED